MIPSVLHAVRLRLLNFYDPRHPSFPSWFQPVIHQKRQPDFSNQVDILGGYHGARLDIVGGESQRLM